ncbi:TetR family transcriptional regulator [Hydrogenispora ethanolica]|jgi:AcrR family transcriptional regulator|uniref:TetR family transcriptional regulator n=1 Tax=Hydrogenispora ethanolica TaxID=1082276 RepID=A0A4R1S1W8_HYDET|nr:TetR/AcrR family transcriptional regulator [Hydrogenispora ethanolica]TCL73148.1 TetR family transcriptional regulator [Hydrogenispora ethanolica]
MSKDVSKKILDATLEVIAKEKISGTRMHLIAKEAAMTQSNLHYYFPTKNDLLIALLADIQEWFSKNRQQVVDLDRQTFRENLHAFFAEKKDVILNHKKLDYVQFDYWVQGTVDPQVRESFRQTFDIWRKDISAVFERGGYSEERIKMIPFLMVSLMMGASMQYLIDEGQFDLDQYFDAAEKIIVNLIDGSK